MNKPFAAHFKDDETIQTIKEHLLGTAMFAESFGQAFGGGEHAYLCGLLHDIGKYSERFQKRIYEGGNPVDHSTAGAVEVNHLIPGIGFLLSYCISGHHTGLPDGGSIADTADEATLHGRLKRTLEEYTAYRNDIKSEIPPAKPRLPIRPLEGVGFSVSFYIRMLFSCLVDGDFLDTEKFMDENKKRGCLGKTEELNLKLDEYLKKLQSPQNHINRKRTEILNCCIEKAGSDKGLFSLTVPTGGGKTISSLAFALKHARHNKMDRVIYVIPYNSIIEQNANIFKDILGEENILEHHSNFSYDDETGNPILERHKLAAENWDSPVTVTTTVQFFESLFASKTSKCRKLHNLANSVIIFDEAQMFPLPYLKPCIRAISELVYNYGASVVLCSATQPSLGDLFPRKLLLQEICNNTEEMYQIFKRTNINLIGDLDDQELAARLNQQSQVLCIVNTRKHAQNIFNLLNGDGCYHLSTFMYPKHRKIILRKIRARLKNGYSCKVISTSLIESGVDVDFPVVYRAEAGLDSLIQAAGRCNREGKRQDSPVFAFKPSKEYREHMPDMMKRPVEVANTIAYQFKDISSPEAINCYFSELYRVTGNGLDTKDVIKRFEAGMENEFSFPFAEVASQFHLIENATRVIIVPKCARAKALLERLKNGERSRNLLRSIQQYSVNIYDRNYSSLYDAGSIQPLDDELAVLIDEKKYNGKTGLDVTADSGVGIFV